MPFGIVSEDGVDMPEYRDDTDKALAFAFGLSKGGDLSDLDRFIFDLPNDAPIKAGLQKLRADAVQYFLRRENHHEMVMFALQKLETIFERVRAIRRENSLRPFAEMGKPFRENATRQDKRGPIAKRIKAHLETHREAKPLDVWRALARNPGKNFVYCDNPQGRYIEDAKTGVTKMKWERFSNLVSEHRPKSA